MTQNSWQQTAYAACLGTLPSAPATSVSAAAITTREEAACRRCAG